MDELRIRATGTEDVVALANLMTELGYPTSVEDMRRSFEEISANPSYGTIVAEREGKVVGMAGLHGVRYAIRKRSHGYSCAVES
jgi:N-acetylglutamate synthase-like GNAT family acetyltransferase